MQGKNKKIYQYDLDGNFIAEYNSLKESCYLNNLDLSGLSKCIDKKKRLNNFLWSSIFYLKYPKNLIKNNPKINNFKSVNCFKNDKLIYTFITITEAASQLNLNRTLIQRCLSGKRKTTGGYIWKYKD
jgi:hypothetical protein